jgi:hypothetical protein
MVKETWQLDLTGWQIQRKMHSLNSVNSDIYLSESFNYSKPKVEIQKNDENKSKDHGPRLQ